MTSRPPRTPRRASWWVGLVAVATVGASVMLPAPATAAPTAAIAPAAPSARAQAAPGSVASAAPTALRTAQRTGPVDLEPGTKPALGWQPPIGGPGAGDGMQSAYRVQVSAAGAPAAEATVWDSGKIESERSQSVAYDGPSLAASGGWTWRVRTWDGDGTASDWSAPASFGTGPGSSWSDSSPVWSPSVAEGWTDATYSGTFAVESVAASVTFRATSTNDFYMWQFRGASAGADANTLKAHVTSNGSYRVISIDALPFTLMNGSTYEFRIATQGSRIVTDLRPAGAQEWSRVSSITDGTHAAGGIGFRTGSSESAFFDDLRVSADDSVLYANDFSAGAEEFACGELRSGRLYVARSRNCLTGAAWQDYTTEADVRIEPGTSTAALAIRGTDAGYYLVQLKQGSPEGLVEIYANRGGSFDRLRSVRVPGIAVAADELHALRVEARGTTLRTYVDDVLVDTLVDTTYRTGRPGVRTGGFEAFEVERLVVTPIGGDPVIDTDFSDGKNPLTCGQVSAGTLTVSRGSSCLTAEESNDWTFLRGEAVPADKEIAYAHLYTAGASAQPARAFVHKVWVNGTFVGIGPVRPIRGETRYDGFDVTGLVRPGQPNAIGALAHTTADKRFQAELVVGYADGTSDVFGSDDTWRSLAGFEAYPASGDIGTQYFTAPMEDVDNRAYPTGFAEPGFEAAGWESPVVKPAFDELLATPTAKVERQLRDPASVTETSPGSYVIDYGRSWLGGLALDLRGEAGQRLDIRYGQVLENGSVKYRTTAGNTYRDQWTLKAGRNQIETWGMRVFRYVEVSGAPTGLGASDFPAMAYVYPFDTDGAVFESSDAELNSVWELSRNTLEALNGNLYVDSWERERQPYEADSYLQLLANLYTTSDPTLGDFSTDYLFVQRTWPTEWPMYVILAVADGFEQTGDAAALARRYDAVKSKLPEQWFEAETGLIRKNSGSNGANSCTDCDIVDWPASERDGFVFRPYNTVINALAVRSYRAMATMATELGRTADVTAYTQRADTIAAAVNERMWDEERGAYRDGLNADRTPVNHFAFQSSVFATAFGVATPDRADRVADYISDRGMNCSVYCAAFVFEALYDGDRADIAFDLLTADGLRSYLNMVRVGAGATMEAWDVSIKGNTTYSHPWAASPAYAMPQGMFGIRPTTPGYRTFDVRPQADRLDWANVTVPSVRGHIGAAYDRVGDRVDVGVHVPANSTATVALPKVPAGTETVYVDGVATPVKVTGGYAEVADVGPGCHVLSTQRGVAVADNERLTTVCPSGWSSPDVVAPTVTVAVDPAEPDGRNGWYVGEVALEASATDDSDGPLTIEIRSGSAGELGDWTAYPGPVTVPEGETVFAVRAADETGNVSDVERVEVSRDATAPGLIWSAAPEDGTSFGAGQVPQQAPTCTATDDLSGPAGCEVTGWSTEPGEHALTATASDVAGNTTVERRTVTVRESWQVRGLERTKGADGSPVKAGSTVPIRFMLLDSAGEVRRSIDAVNDIRLYVGCVAEESRADAGDLRFATRGGGLSVQDDGFAVNWATPRGASGCHTVVVEVADGTEHAVEVILR
ncbi:glycoside hydrolase family 78 protein [Nocardioidaceae bacterium]|nr:glycoside hydrolase family 78 protein [Nocardioidaceae bacterium]